MTNTIIKNRITVNKVTRPYIDCDILELILTLSNGAEDIIRLLNDANEICFLIMDSEAGVKIENLIDDILNY